MSTVNVISVRWTSFEVWMLVHFNRDISTPAVLEWLWDLNSYKPVIMRVAFYQLGQLTAMAFDCAPRHCKFGIGGNCKDSCLGELVWRDPTWKVQAYNGDNSKRAMTQRALCRRLLAVVCSVSSRFQRESWLFSKAAEKKTECKGSLHFCVAYTMRRVSLSVGTCTKQGKGTFGNSTPTRFHFMPRCF